MTQTMISSQASTETSAQAGFGIVAYIIAAVALLAALMSMLAVDTSTSTVDTANYATDQKLIESQAVAIASTITACAISAANDSEVSTGYPSRNFQATPTGNLSDERASISDIYCPGEMNNDGNRIPVFGSGVAVPQLMAGLEVAPRGVTAENQNLDSNWSYIRNADGVSISTYFSDLYPAEVRANMLRSLQLNLGQAARVTCNNRRLVYMIQITGGDPDAHEDPLLYPCGGA